MMRAREIEEQLVKKGFGWCEFIYKMILHVCELVYVLETCVWLNYL